MLSFFKSLRLLPILILSLTAHAENSWFGNVVLHSELRGRISDTLYMGQEIQKNIADYNVLTIYFDFYKEGVTESEFDLWKRVEAKAQTIDDTSGLIIKENFIPIVGHRDHNAIYGLRINSLAPDTFGELPPALRFHGSMPTHIQIVIDGAVKLSIPVIFTYNP